MNREKPIQKHISIVMPVHNRAKFLQEAIESALGQKYENYELIIVVDGPVNSDTMEILQKYKVNPHITIYQKQRNEGPGSAVNFGVSKAKSDYFCRLDSDDVLKPEAMSVLNEYIGKYPDVSYFYTSRYVIDENSKVVITHETLPDGMHRSRKFNKERLLKEYHCNHLICWKKKDFLSVGGMRENMFWAEDWELALRMSEKYLFRNIDEPLYFVREYSGERLTCTTSDEAKNRIVRKMLENLKKRKFERRKHYPNVLQLKKAK